mmetsp:Transcript_30000/g.75665  ORF Transcript_30000/g.75665 Transcript_30000/m.75665 type:complete len:218 (+) Transcript_30000:1731-2384(+)
MVGEHCEIAFAADKIGAQPSSGRGRDTRSVFRVYARRPRLEHRHWQRVVRHAFIEFRGPVYRESAEALRGVQCAACFLLRGDLCLLGLHVEHLHRGGGGGVREAAAHVKVRVPAGSGAKDPVFPDHGARPSLRTHQQEDGLQSRHCCLPYSLGSAAGWAPAGETMAVDPIDLGDVPGHNDPRDLPKSDRALGSSARRVLQRAASVDGASGRSLRGGR